MATRTVEEIVKAGVNSYKHAHLNSEPGVARKEAKAIIRVLMVKLRVYDDFCASLNAAAEHLPGVNSDES